MVAAALTPPVVGGIRPTENLEDVDIFEDRDPGRKGEAKRGADPVWCDGEGGGGGEVVGEGVLLFG